MKKLMVAAAAALTATIGFSVESSNIVGYNTQGLQPGGFKMKSPSFLSIGSNGTYLSSIKPTGYENNSDLKDAEETRGEFSIQLLTQYGELLSMYQWVQPYENDEWGEGYWLTPGNVRIVPGSSNDLLLAPGAGIWFSAADVSDDDSEATYSEISSGSVNTNDVTVSLVPGGFGAFGNPYPVAIKLSTLVPTGYQGNQDLMDAEETRGEFSIQLLTQYGELLSMYQWVQSYDGSEWVDDGHWLDPSNATIVPGGANDLTINPGDGLWISAPDHADDDGADYTITFKYP